MYIAPFRPLRPRPDLVERIACLPYDVVSTEEARSLAAGNPLSLLHVVRPEIDFPVDADPYAPVVYQHAATQLRNLQEQGALIWENQPCLYLYQQMQGEHRQRGLAALGRVQDYDEGIIKKHEKTRPEKEDDRTHLTATVNANPGPVFLTYRDRSDIDALLEQEVTAPPLYDFITEDTIRHTVWRIPQSAALVAAVAQVACAYIADGHHRAASAARVGRERRQANPQHTGKEAYHGFLCVFFPASQLNILAYNRLVRDLNGLSPDDFLQAAALVGKIKPTGSAIPSAPGELCCYIGRQWYRLRFPAVLAEDAVARLDVSRLQDQLLGPVLGVDDPRTSKRLRFVGGVRGTDYLQEQVDSGRAAIAFSLYPVQVNQLMEIADAHRVMPPKSTWFEPKLRSGLFIHTLDGVSS